MTFCKMSFCYLAVNACLLLFSGCGYLRTTTYFEEPCAELSVVTSNKYKLTDLYVEWFGETKTAPDFEEIRRICCSDYPGVFTSSDEGIPVVAKRGKIRYSDGDMLWTIGFSIWNLALIMPSFQHGETTCMYDIIVPDTNNRECVRQHSACDTTFCNSPLGYFYRVFPQGGGTVQKGYRIFEDVECFSFATNGNGARKQSCRAIAHGLALGLKKMETAGKISGDINERVRWRNRYEHAGASEPGESQIADIRQLYSLQTLKTDPGRDFAYSFVLNVKEEALQNPQINNEIKDDFRTLILSDYKRAYPNMDQRELRVDFPEFHLGRVTTGKAVVLSFRLISLEYDSNTRKGRMSVRIMPNQYEVARAWVRGNIEILAREKNIAHVTGERPPAARYYMLNEHVLDTQDGKILEIEFKTE